MHFRNVIALLLSFGLNLSAQADELAIIYKCLNAQNKQFELTIYPNSIYFKDSQSALYLYKDEASTNAEYDRSTEVLFNNDDLDLIIPKNFYSFIKEGMIRLTDYQDNSYAQLYCKFLKVTEATFPNP